MGRILGIDLGERRMGIALSDSLGMTAQGLTTLERTGPRADLKAIAGLLEKHSVEAIVVGLPLTLKGERGVKAKESEAFAETLRGRFDIPVHLIDERLSTVEGTRALLGAGASRKRRKRIIDEVAAQLILQQFLERQRLKDAQS